MKKIFTGVCTFFKKMNKMNKILLGLALIIVCGMIVFLLLFNSKDSVDNFKITDVTAKNIKNNIIENNTSFVVETENGTTKKLEEHLYLEPAVDYDIKKIDKDKYEIKLGAPIGDNTILNIDYVKDEVAAYKWAFQTKNDLSVNAIYPADGAAYVNENSAVEILFSYPNVKNLEQHFEISPSVEGSFINNGRYWTFIPNEPLQQRTTYTITVTAGVESDGQIMKEDFKSTFSTYSKYEAEKYENDYITFDKINTFLPTDKPKIKLAYGDINDIKKIEVYSVSSYSNYIKYLNGENIQLENKKEVEFTIDGKLLTLNNSLSVGYYVFYLVGENNETLLKANVQVNDLSAYALLTQRDALVWVSNGTKLKEGEVVKYKDKTQKTNKDGYTILKEISDFSNDIDYLTIGEGNNPLVVGLMNYEYSTLPTSYIYSDRLLYKTNDVINIWGYIPLDFFADKPDLDKFYIKLGEERFDVEINSDGTYTSKIELKNYKETTETINLFYNDSQIANRYVYIENYNAKNYIYMINTTKNYVKAGENVDFTVSVEHVTGLKAINKDIVVTFNDKEYYGKTDNNGVVKFSVPTEKNNLTYLQSTISIKVNGANADHGKYLTEKTIYVYNTDIDITSELDQEKSTITYDVKKYDLTTNTNTDYNGSNIVKSNYNGKATVTIYEEVFTRITEGTYYDSYEKKYLPNYRYTNLTNILKQQEVDVQNGKLKYEYSINFNEATEEKNYVYYVELKVADSDNKFIAYRPSIASFYSSSSDYKGIYDYKYFSYYNIPNSYNSYNYELAKTNKNIYDYSIGDTIGLKLSDGKEYFENKGKVLEVDFKEKIISTKIVDNSDLNYKFTKNSYPGCNMTGVYFVDGKFYRMPVKYFDYNSDDSELKVEVSPSKKEYKPGDEVTGTISVVDKNGKKVDAKLNISVVNEEVFNSVEDETNILSKIFADKRLQSYTFSTYRDYTLNSGGGGGAAGGSPRADFGDTIYFDTLNAKNGKAEFKFKLNDQITKFRITVHAVSKQSGITYAGVNNEKITSFLPLSITSIAPKNIKSTDDLVLNATILNSVGNNTKINFKIKETGKEIDVNGTQGETVTANFGKLEMGSYNVIIKGMSGDNEDSLTYKIDIAETAQEIAIKKVESIKNNSKINPTKNPIIIEVYNKKIETYLKYLNHLEGHFSSRLDTQISYYKALELKNKYYDNDEEVTIPSFDEYKTNNGIKNLENAEADLILTGLTNYYASSYININSDPFKLGIEKDMDKVMKNYFVRASFKEPILIELNAINRNNLSLESKLLLGVSYAFLGDYNNAKKIYEMIDESKTTDVLNDLYIVLATFIDKSKAEQLINTSISTRPASEYLNYAILSYFENNIVSLSKEESVTIKTNKINEKVVLSGLKVKKMVLYDEDLKSLTFKTSSKDLLVSYYYQGKISESSEYQKNIDISLDGSLVENSVVKLKIDIKNITNHTATINVALPNSLRLSDTFKNIKGLYLNKNNNGTISFGLTDDYSSNMIEIPLYVSTKGNYEIEPIVIMSDNKYNISNNLIIDIN